jgi:hypothetical protein
VAAMRTEDEANDQADSCFGQAAVLHCLRACDIHPPIMPPIFTARCKPPCAKDAGSSAIRLSSVDGPRAPCGIDPTGTGILSIALKRLAVKQDAEEKLGGRDGSAVPLEAVPGSSARQADTTQCTPESSNHGWHVEANG